MLKKMIVVSAAAAIAMLGGVGIASAHEGGHGGNTHCTSDDTTRQSNKGDQLLGGNLSVQDLDGNVLGAQATRPAGICPSVLNNNHL